MCRHCKEEEVVRTSWIPDEQDVGCEWYDESDGAADADADGKSAETDFCPDRAAVAVQTYMVEEHLCESHTASRQREVPGEEGEFVKDLGLADESRFLPLGEGDEEFCERCGAPAAFAHVITFTQCFCRAHAREAGATLPPPR